MAMWDMETSTWSSVGSNVASGPFDEVVHSLVVNNSVLFAAGDFNTAYTPSGVAIRCTATIARWNVSSRQWYPLYNAGNTPGGFNYGGVRQLALNGSLLYFAGPFYDIYLGAPTTSIDGTTNSISTSTHLGCKGVAYWNASVSKFQCAGNGFTNGKTTHVTIDGDDVYWGGNFDNMMDRNGNSVLTNPTSYGIAIFNIVSRRWRQFHLGLEVSSGSTFTVRRSTLYPDLLYVTGNDIFRNDTAPRGSAYDPDLFMRSRVTSFNTTSNKYQGLPYYTSAGAGLIRGYAGSYFSVMDVPDQGIFLAGDIRGGNVIKYSLLPTPSDSATATSSATSSATGSSTRSATATGSSTKTGTATGTIVTPTRTATASPTASGSLTASVTGTGSTSMSTTMTATQSATGSMTASQSATGSMTATQSATGSMTATQSAAPTSSSTVSVTASVTSSGSQSSTLSSTATSSVTASVTASSTVSATSTVTSSGSETSTVSSTVSATSTVTSSDSETSTVSSTVSATSTASRSGSETSTASSTVSATSTVTSSGSETSTVTSSGSETSTVTSSGSETSSLSATATASATASVTASASATASVSLTSGLTRSITASSSPMPRPVLALGLSLLGGATGALRQGTGVALRGGVLALLQLDAGASVLITSVIESTYTLVNITQALGGAANNSTTASAAAGNLTAAGVDLGNSSGTATVVVSSSDPLNAPLSGGARRRRLADAGGNASSACATTSLTGTVNITTSEVQMAIDLSADYFASVGATTQEARIAVMRDLQARAEAALQNATAVSVALQTALTIWGNCTGVGPDVAVIGASASVIIPSASPSASPRAAYAAAAVPDPFNLPAFIAVGILALLALCCCCCFGCAAPGFRRKQPPLPVLRVSLSTDQVFFLRLRLGAAVPDKEDERPTSDTTSERRRSVFSRARRVPHTLVAEVPKGAACRSALGLAESDERLEVPVAILTHTPESSATATESSAAPVPTQAAPRPVHWFFDGKGREGRERAPLWDAGWSVTCEWLHDPARMESGGTPVAALRVASLPERCLVLDDGHNGDAEVEDRAAGSVEPGAVLTVKQLSQLLARDLEADAPPETAENERAV